MKMKISVSLALLPLVVFGIGCKGAVTRQTVAPSPTPNVRYVPKENSVYLADIQRVAIFPFADYSHQQDSMGIDAWGGNIKIQEEITDHLVSHGISVTVQEDVNTLLVDQDIIRPIDKDNYLLYGSYEEENEQYRQIGTPEYELLNFEHSAAINDELMRVIRREKHKKEGDKPKSPFIQGATVGLTKEKIVELAQILDVDLVIRGRIIDYGYKDVGTVNPLFRGIVPVVIDSVKDLLFGAGGAYGYENDLEDIESILAGAAMGYAVGNQIVSTSTSRSSSISNGIVSRRVSRSDRDHDAQAIEGAAVGAAAGWMSGRHPKKAKRSAVVQVRLYAQDAATGNVLWSNRAEIEYTPKSYYAFENTHPKVMFDNAVKESIKTLMNSFFAESENVFSVKQPVVVKEGA